MKNKIVLSSAVVIFCIVVLAGLGYARGGYRGCDDCGGCYQQKECKPGIGKISPEHKKFREETMPYRRQLIEKRFELEKEYLSETPDKEKIAKLEKEREDLYGKVLEMRKKYGFKTGKIKTKARDCWN